jgi:hypothetical protein
MIGVPARWRGRLAGGVALAGAGYVVTLLLDMDPRPLPYVVWSVVVLALAFLVLDIVDVPAAEWQQGTPSSSDRVDEATSDLRLLSSHHQADQPSDALARRLAALARGRDTGLGDAVERELADTRRLTPADIDRILTRIEDVRDDS